MFYIITQNYNIASFYKFLLLVIASLETNDSNTVGDKGANVMFLLTVNSSTKVL